MNSMTLAPYKIIILLFISCNFLHELYPFYQSEAARVPPTNTTASQRQGGISSGTIVAIVVPISVVVLILIVGTSLSKRTRKKYDSALQGKSAIDISNLDSLQYDFRTIKAATNNFSEDNKIGRGGFGKVYKGTLANGQEIAVKRLSPESRQGVQEFKNEVEVLAKLQHRNLVRLLGYSMQRAERVLVYEYVSNRSIDYILFDHEKKTRLDWTMRYKIIKGIAQGIQYLHEDARIKIVHRDIKLSNILLDSYLNPKITDFGIAIIFRVDETQQNIDSITGTPSYISPEHAMYGHLSVKSDVFSFGILLMEIISGRKHSSFSQIRDSPEDLVTYAWNLWKHGDPLELLDPTITESCTPNEVMRCIQIGLLCVQEDPADRPSMSSILVMLEIYPMTLPTPSQPAFFVDRRTDPTAMSVNEMSVSEVMPR